jgi:hypothetical protein
MVSPDFLTAVANQLWTYRRVMAAIMIVGDG